MIKKFLSNEDKGHFTRNIKLVLQHRYRFKLVIKFKNSPEYGASTGSITLYGNEHKCTYNQCLAGKVPNITLDQIQGYNGLIHQVEKEWKGKYSTAKIFGREPGTETHEQLHRVYIKGKLQKDDVLDPVFGDEHITVLFYKVESGRLVISETPFNE